MRLSLYGVCHNFTFEQRHRLKQSSVYALLPCKLRTMIHQVLQLTCQLLLLYGSLSRGWNDCMAKHAKTKSGNTAWALHCLIGKYRKGSFQNTLESRREHFADAVLVSFQLRLLPENFVILLYSALICDTSCFAFWRACRRPATSSFSASTSLTSSLVNADHCWSMWGQNIKR